MTKYRRIFSPNKYVFITFVTFRRNPILIENIELLKASFKNARKKFTFDIYAIVVLPDHVHMIIKPSNINEYPKIITNIKTHFSLNIDQSYIADAQLLMTESNIKRREKGVWQRRYWEHTIKNTEDLHKHLNYIHYNPVKHDLVKTPNDWEHSSFHKFIEQGFYKDNWSSSEDIDDLEAE